ncbi:uncharacterized protein BDV14DRAFT_202269 [Aspergillus stella-maris]|uniref:uncharacterized protein n=1 Tax=Aspergillus stella-maris TaxID=1810926 RepID=UPI003CCD3664
MANSFLDLPVELILLIVEQTSKSTQASVVRTCKFARKGVNSVLYTLSDTQRQDVFVWAGYKGQHRLMEQFLPDAIRMGRGDPEFEHEALILAARAGCLNMFQTMLNYGASLEYSGLGRRARSEWRERTLDCALWPYGEGKISNLGDSALMAAAKSGQVDILAILPEEYLNSKLVNQIDERMRPTPLMAACRGGHTRFMQSLPQFGAVLSLRTRHSSPLIEVASGGSVEAMGILRQSGHSYYRPQKGWPQMTH